MNGHKTRMVRIGAALAPAALLLSGAAMAQAPAAQSMPTPQVSAETCAEVQWSPQILAQYPRLPEACQEVVTVNGQNWARFEGRLVRVNPNGSVTSMVIDPNGKRIGQITLKPAPGQKVLLEGREYSFNQLRTGAILHLYIPEHMYAVATEPTEPSEMAEIEAPPPQELPKTAGPLPWILVAGGALMLVGLGLTLGRRFMG